MNKFLNKIFIWFNIFASLAILLSYLSVYVNPSKIAFLSFFGLAYPYLLVLNIFFGLGWGIKFRKIAFLSVIVILVGYSHFNNFIQFGNKNSNEFDFSVTTYNVRMFNLWEKGSKSEAKIVEFLSQNLLDIVCLQEYYPSYRVEGVKRSFVDAINPNYNYHLKLLNRLGKYSTGIITVSRFPIIHKGDIIHPESASLTIYTDILISGDTVRVYNNHLQSFRLGRMESSFFTEVGADKSMEEIKSISKQLTKGFAQRATQSQLVSAHIAQSPHPVIVCGDFNDTPVSYTYTKLKNQLDDAFVKAGKGIGYTYKGRYPSNRIDYILFDNIFRCDSFGVAHINYSDHYPVSGGFSFK